MASITHIYALEYAAKMMDEDLELLEAIVWNDDNLTYGSIISVYTGPDETITAMTDDGIEELTNMITTKTWHESLDTFVDDKKTRHAYQGSTNAVTTGRLPPHLHRQHIHHAQDTQAFGRTVP